MRNYKCGTILLCLCLAAIITFLLPLTANSQSSPPSGAAAPTLVQAVSTSNTKGNVVSTYTIRLPNATLSGNALIVAVQQNSGTGTLSVSDDARNTYRLARSNDNGSQLVSIY